MAERLMLLVWRRAADDFGILLNLDVNKIPSRLCVSVYPEMAPAIAFQGERCAITLLSVRTEIEHHINIRDNPVIIENKRVP